jgi:putative membrane protein
MSALLPVVSVMLVGVLYAHGVWRPGRRRLREQVLGRWRVAGFLGGITVVAVALAPPMHRAADLSLAGHMIQHLLLIAVAAPALAFGRPTFVLGAAGSPLRAVVRRAAPLARRILERPLLVWILHVGVLWLWHLPGPYALALVDPVVHALAHVTLLASSVTFWLVVTEPGAPRLAPLPAACYLVAAALQSGALGALLTLSETPWYPAAASALTDPLRDQQLAGVLMWVPASVLYLGGTLAVVAGSLRAAERGP